MTLCLTILVKIIYNQNIISKQRISKEEKSMLEATAGGLCRSRKMGGFGRIEIAPDVIKAIQGLAPQWEKLNPKKILDMVDRALPKILSSKETLCFHIPGGGKVSIPVTIEENLTSGPLQISLQPEKPIKTFPPLVVI
ncbi:MAG TPA: hypothetical protein ENN28_03075 [Candidatus Uhrbacteria bacterium]|nr:hypothetical protein [Candidatus Uhrbacteria bacterium]